MDSPPISPSASGAEQHAVLREVLEEGLRREMTCLGQTLQESIRADLKEFLHSWAPASERSNFRRVTSDTGDGETNGEPSGDEDVKSFQLSTERSEEPPTGFSLGIVAGAPPPLPKGPDTFKAIPGVPQGRLGGFFAVPANGMPPEAPKDDFMGGLMRPRRRSLMPGTVEHMMAAQPKRRLSVMPTAAALPDAVINAAPKRGAPVQIAQPSNLELPGALQKGSVLPVPQSAMRKKREGTVDGGTTPDTSIDSPKHSDTNTPKHSANGDGPPKRRISVNSQTSGKSPAQGYNLFEFMEPSVPNTVPLDDDSDLPSEFEPQMERKVSPPMSSIRKSITAEKMRLDGKRKSTWGDTPIALEDLDFGDGGWSLQNSCVMAKALMQRLIQHEAFEYIACTCIALNAVAAGLQAEYSMRSLPDETPSVFRSFEVAFLALFAAEFVLRAAAVGVPGVFTQEKEGFWNVMDACILVFQILDEVAIGCVESWGPSSLPATFNFIRAARLTRLVRIMRVFRLMAMFQDLRAMVESIASSCKSLLWTVLLFLLLTYVTGVYMTDLVAAQARKNPAILVEGSDGQGSRLGEFYGTTPRALLSMFQAVTGGVDWNDLLQPLLEEVHPALALPFTMYIAFTVLAMMNVITGIFVESALATARGSKDAELLNNMCALFLNTDKDRSGMISWDEFAGQLEDPDMARCFKLLDIELSEARGLFTLLDTDTSGEIDAEEFIMGCLRLQGAAKAIDLATLMYFNKRMATWWSSQMSAVHDSLADIAFACGCPGEGEDQGSPSECDSPRTPRAASEKDGSPVTKTSSMASERGPTGSSRNSTEAQREANSLAAFATWSGLKSEARSSSMAPPRGSSFSPGHSGSMHSRMVTA